MEVGAEAAHRLHRHLVAAHEPVVAEHRRHGDRQADRRHDQRFADRAGDLVDRRLAGDADRGQRVVDAPDRAEQADERRRRADGGEEGKAVLKPALDVVDAALHAHRHPRVVVDVLGERAFVVLAGADAAVGDEAEGAAGLQRLGAFLQRLRLEERALRGLRLGAQLQALVELGDQDVPAAHAHQDQDDQRAAGDEVALLPERAEAVRVVDGLLAGRRRGHRRRRRRRRRRGRLGRRGRRRRRGGCRLRACRQGRQGETRKGPARRESSRFAPRSGRYAA